MASLLQAKISPSGLIDDAQEWAQANQMLAIIIGVICILFLLFCCAWICFCCCCCKRKKKKNKKQVPMTPFERERVFSSQATADDGKVSPQMIMAAQQQQLNEEEANKGLIKSNADVEQGYIDAHEDYDSKLEEIQAKTKVDYSFLLQKQQEYNAENSPQQQQPANVNNYNDVPPPPMQTTPMGLTQPAQENPYAANQPFVYQGGLGGNGW
eukprot:CAMPEP_0197045588 /NCGR_PEP_ID=MMETSP1384-20130603/21417_1 /TAXON_ID=29189 /ORGANISM="Ammonia sp." /LENGTH=210 /DNA_ID=CAMNT_0042477225 /DNA_START=54 /DNA_END=683 /DNA_ORIENTATION=+